VTPSPLGRSRQKTRKIPVSIELPEFKVRNDGSQKAPKGASKTDGCPHAAFFTNPGADTAIETQRLGGAHRCALPWSILAWHSYARYIEHRAKRCAYVLPYGNGMGCA
jgi:hypothetical protein